MVSRVLIYYLVMWLILQVTFWVNWGLLYFLHFWVMLFISFPFLFLYYTWILHLKFCSCWLNVPFGNHKVLLAPPLKKNSNKDFFCLCCFKAVFCLINLQVYLCFYIHTLICEDRVWIGFPTYCNALGGLPP